MLTCLGITKLLISYGTPYWLQEPAEDDPKQDSWIFFPEFNQCANALAKLGTSQTCCFVLHDNPTPVLLAFDKVKLFCARIVYV